jgi:hypothetical protein
MVTDWLRLNSVAKTCPSRVNLRLGAADLLNQAALDG